MSLILAIGCTITSSVFHDATITVIMVFAFVPVFMSMGMKPGKGHRLPTFFFMLIPLSASAGGFATLLGGGRNPLALEILQKFSGGADQRSAFWNTSSSMFPICILTAVATWAILWVLLRPKEKELVGVELAAPGPMSGKEWGVRGGLRNHVHSLVFGGPDRLALQRTGGFCPARFLRARLGQLPNHLRQIPVGVLDRLRRRASRMGVSMLDSGAGRFLAETLLPLLDGQPTFVVYYGMGFFGSFLSSLMSNSAAVALMLPITFCPWPS